MPSQPKKVLSVLLIFLFASIVSGKNIKENENLDNYFFNVNTGFPFIDYQDDAKYSNDYDTKLKIFMDLNLLFKVSGKLLIGGTVFGFYHWTKGDNQPEMGLISCIIGPKISFFASSILSGFFIESSFGLSFASTGNFATGYGAILGGGYSIPIKRNKFALLFGANIGYIKLYAPDDNGQSGIQTVNPYIGLMW